MIFNAIVFFSGDVVQEISICEMSGESGYESPEDWCEKKGFDGWAVRAEILDAAQIGDKAKISTVDGRLKAASELIRQPIAE